MVLSCFMAIFSSGNKKAIDFALLTDGIDSARNVSNCIMQVSQPVHKLDDLHCPTAML